MYFLLNPPLPPIAPGLSAPAQSGPYGEWIIPGIIIAISLFIDWTAIGAANKRDRFAASLTYGAALAFIKIFNLGPTIQAWPGQSWSMLLAGSAIAFIFHVGFAVVLVGLWIDKLKPLAVKLSGIMGIDGKAGRSPVNRSPGTDVAVYDADTASRNSRGRGTVARTTNTSTNTSGIGRINTKLHVAAIVVAITYVLARGPAAVAPEWIGTTLAKSSGSVSMFVVHGLGG